MKRRKFTHSILAGIGLSNLPLTISLASSEFVHELQKHKEVSTSEQLSLSLNEVLYPTNNKDKKQFILIYNVTNHTNSLEEKIYNVVAQGKTHRVYMTPIAKNKLQAVFNTRINA